MPVSDVLTAAGVAVLAGLDRTAAFQVMISRPIVAAPLTGWLLGAPLVGLQVGVLVELLWLGRLPIGAAIPPDDTQVAVASTFLAISLGPLLHLSGLPFTVLCTLIAMPLGTIGQVFDRLARHWNGKLLKMTAVSLERGEVEGVERYHLWGLGHFALASLAAFSVIAGIGALILYFLAPLVMGPVASSTPVLYILFPLVGVSALLGMVHLRRSIPLFGVSFAAVLLLLWVF
jgi:PTS system mannose-specific IIC component